MKTLRKCSNIRLAAFFGTLLAFPIVQAVPEATQVKGTATYRERIALTPDAVFEATLQDVSKADAPAVAVGSVRIEKPGQVPIRFEIPYDPAHVDQSHSHAVRSRILVGQRLLFTTDQVYPVLTRDNGNDVQITLRMVAASKPPSKSAAQASPLGTLPASFIGELPCADCPGIRYHVNLFPDRVFFLRTTYIGRGDDAAHDDIGSWVMSSDRTMLLLKGGREAPAMFRIKDENTLRMLNIEGRDIESPLNYDLQRTKSFELLEPRLAMRGMYRYFADAGLFTECLTRRKWPLAQEKDNAALESAYSKARLTAGEELLVNLEGQLTTRPKMEGQGTQPTLVVERFIGVWPTEKCSARFSSAALESTYWKLTRLGDKPVSVAAKQREPHFVLDSKTKRIAGSGGCNRFTGSYQRTGDRLTFGKVAMTFMACPEGMETEREFLAALEQVRSLKIFGEDLELLDSNGGFLARFEARPSKQPWIRRSVAAAVKGGVATGHLSSRYPRSSSSPTDIDRFVESYRKAGGQIEFALFEGEAEGFIKRNAGSPAAARAMDKIKQFVHNEISG
jgi:copper homeostasis protein (lipoprotein)